MDECQISEFQTYDIVKLVLITYDCSSDACRCRWDFPLKKRVLKMGTDITVPIRHGAQDTEGKCKP